jgi:hypothetical protein
MSDLSNTQRPHRRFFVGLAVVIFAVACVIVGFVGFRLGFDRGYTTAQPRRVKEELREVVYEVGDLLEPDVYNNGKPDFQSLIDALVGTIALESWDDVGGLGTIVAEEPNGIRVNQSPDVHVLIEQILKSLREGRRLAGAHPAK